MRLMYAAGPGNVIGTYLHWKKGEDDPSQPALTYSGQFFDVCRLLEADALVISSNAGKASLVDGKFELHHVPKLAAAANGFFYHAVQVLYGLRIVFHAARFRPDYMVVAEGTTHWFVFFLLSRRVRIIATLHCLLWLPAQRPSTLQQWLDRCFFEKRAHAVMTVSENITQQLVELTRGRSAPVFPFTPTYKPDTFRHIASPKTWPPFRVLYVGRVEANKGVFTLLDVACEIAKEGWDVQFDICGNGSALNELKQAARERGVEATFHCYGYCDREATLGRFEASHVVVVPTTTAFNEGFNKVVVEAVLAGRPFITSSVCPALSYVREAGLEVPPDDTAAYRQAILRLFEDQGLYERKRLACAQYAGQFFDRSRGWAAALEASITKRTPSANPPKLRNELSG